MDVSAEQGEPQEPPRASLRPPAGESVAELYEQHFAFVWRALRALGIPPAGLDDAVQEVFLVVHRRAGEFAHRSSARTWLFGIAYRVAANLRRGAKRRPTEPLSDEPLADQPSPEQHAARAEAARFVERFLSELDEELRVAFVACVLEGMSAPEAAEALGANVNTLYSRVRAARARFVRALAERSKRP